MFAFFLLNHLGFILYIVCSENITEFHFNIFRAYKVESISRNEHHTNWKRHGDKSTHSARNFTPHKPHNINLSTQRRWFTWNERAVQAIRNVAQVEWEKIYLERLWEPRRFDGCEFNWNQSFLICFYFEYRIQLFQCVFIHSVKDFCFYFIFYIIKPVFFK